jgi:hypothetical protein
MRGTYVYVLRCCLLEPPPSGSILASTGLSSSLPLRAAICLTEGSKTFLVEMLLRLTATLMMTKELGLQSIWEFGLFPLVIRFVMQEVTDGPL